MAVPRPLNAALGLRVDASVPSAKYCLAQVVGISLLLCVLSAQANPASSTQSRYSTGLDRCEERGGERQVVGVDEVPTCIVPYADAGKSCKTKADCIGFCMASMMSIQGYEPAAGTCQIDAADAFGCYSQVLNGRAMPAVCVD